MKAFLISVSILAASLLANPARAEEKPALMPVQSGRAWQRFVDSEVWGRKEELLQAISNSLRYLDSESARLVYEDFTRAGIARATVVRSLQHFHDVLEETDSAKQLYSRLLREFDVFQSIGRDGKGTVRFTAYFQPTYQASRVRTSEYRYPIFRRPPAFAEWRRPHPTRVELEGYDGTGNPKGRLHGLELAWLKSRYEAFMIHVQGSALLELPDNSKMSVGYAGNTNYAFVGFNAACLKRKPRSLSGHDFFARNAAELDKCLARNNRFIFFQERPTADAIGSLGVPVTAGHSIATDKSLMPPGAFGIIRTAMPHRRIDGSLETRVTNRLILDQDAGGAIKGPGRVDIYMGTGAEAGEVAKSMRADGQLYYFFLKDGSAAKRGVE